MDDQMKARLTSSNLWMRALYMIFFVIAYGVAELLIALIAIFQFLTILFTGSANAPLLRLGRNLGEYVFQILQFQTFNSEDKPFPFSDWPDEEPGGDQWQGNDPEPPAPDTVDRNAEAPISEDATSSENKNSAEPEVGSDQVEDPEVSGSRKDANPPPL